MYEAASLLFRTVMFLAAVHYAALLLQIPVVALEPWDRAVLHDAPGFVHFVPYAAGAACLLALAVLVGTALIVRKWGFGPKAFLAAVGSWAVGVAAIAFVNPMIFSVPSMVFPGYGMMATLLGTDAPTRFSPGYSPDAFLGIEPGMTTEQVIARLGSPLESHTHSSTYVWVRRALGLRGSDTGSNGGESLPTKVEFLRYSGTAHLRNPGGTLDVSHWSATVYVDPATERVLTRRFAFERDSTD